MSQNVRFVLFLLISVGIIVVWSAYFGPKPKPKGPDQAVATGTPDGGTPAPAPGETAGGIAAPSPAGKPEEAEPEVATTKVETDKWTAVFSTKGAGLQSFVLKGDKQHRHSEKGSEGFDLAHAGENQPLPLAVEVGPVGPTAGYKLVSQTPTELRYERTKAGWTVTKTFHVDPGSYRLGLDVQVQRADGMKEATPVSVVYPAHEPKPETGGFFASALARAEIHQAVCYLSGASMKTRGYKTQDEAPTTYPEPAGFAGIDEKYFLAAIAPAAGQEPGQCTLASPAATDLVATYAAPLGKDGVAKFDVFLGPKSSEQLEAFGHHTDVSITNGGPSKIALTILLPILKFFHELVKNWGIAIILLTLLVKLVTFPLAHRQMKSMEAMKVLGPKMEEIKKKYENDPQKQNLETMRLYKEHNINPIGCAVPMLVQMPIWMGLYATLQNSFELYNEPFFGWIKDLTVHDPFYVLPVLMTATMIITQVLTPQTSPQAQQMKGMTYGMPVFFGFMMLSLPAGLVLYIFTNNLLSIAQSLWFRKAVAKQAPAK